MAVSYLFANEQQRELGELARRILETELAPRLDELEKNHEYPQDVADKLSEAGFSCPGAPEEWGGLGLGLVDKCVIYEEMARVSAGFTFAYHGDLTDMIAEAQLPEEEKRDWIERCIAGTTFGNFALTEPEAGSDALGIKTTAVFDEKTREWVINGTKCFASHANRADFMIVIAYTDKAARGHGMTAFFVEKERGYQVPKIESKMGMHLSHTCDVVFDNVRVPEDHVIGKVGGGLAVAMSKINEARINTLSMGLGLAQAALDYAVSYAKERRQKGKRIIDFQGLGFMIAEMQTQVNAARALLYYAANAYDQGLPMGSLASQVKVFVSDTAMRVTTDAVQVLGGYGLMTDYPVQRYMRDAKVFQIFEGTNQIQLDTIARTLAGRDPMTVKK